MERMNDRQLADKVVLWLATGLGIGMVSPAPGTVGGLWGLPLAVAVGLLPYAGAELFVIALLALVSIAICSRASRVLGETKDPQVVVLDEIVALPIVFLGVEPTGAAVWLAGWLLFRLFDITKLPPVRRLEELPDGWGIVADDLAAAAQACVALHLLLWLDDKLALGMFAAAA